MKTEWFFCRKVRWKTTIRFKCLLLLLVVFSGWFTYELIFTKLHLFLSPRTALARADALIVEGWVFDSGKGLALDLYRRGFAKYIVTTGGPILRDAACFEHGTWAESAKHYFVSSGVEDSRIVSVGTQVRGTRQEALALRPVLERLDVSSMILVTQRGHERRSYMAFRKVFEGREIPISVTAADEEWFRADNWWKSHDGLILLFTEYLSLFYYWFNDYI